MTNFDLWQGSSIAALDPTSRAIATWRLIGRYPTQLVVVREGSADLAAQTVRIEVDNTLRAVRGQSDTETERREALVFGVADHPTVPDTDLQQGDRFALAGQVYRVRDVVRVPGGLQAWCEVVT